MLSVIHTDGSCLNNPGPGGWAFRMDDGQRIWLVSGGENNTTNNRMELLAVIEALSFCQTVTCKIYSDSLLTIKCATGVWKRKSNLDLWAKYVISSKGKTIEWEWVKGHSGDPRNDEVDVAARTEAEKLKLKSF
jgi:ribonuclease HI